MKISNQININSTFIKTVLSIFIISIIAYFQLFHKLDELPLRVWDEGQNAVNAYEMMQNKNFLVRYYEGKPEEWNLKPPLLTWHQVIAMKLFGINDFSIRLPSAVYAYLTALFIFFFITSEYKLYNVGILAAFILLTSYGYLERHIARSGDHDSMLTFFLTIQAIYFYKYINHQHFKHLLVITAALILGTLTKSVAGLFFIPGFILYVIKKRKLINILRSKEIYLSIILYIVVIGCYYLLMEKNSPGYLKTIWVNELFPRYSNSASNYTYQNLDNYLYYLRNFWDNRLVPWVYVIPLLFIVPFFSKEKKIKSLHSYLLIVCITFLLLISFGTKNLWYDAPLYPIIAIITSIGIWQVFVLITKLPLYKPIKYGLYLLIMAPLIYFPIIETKKLTFEINERYWNYEVQGISYFLRDKIRHSEQIQNLGIAYSAYHSHIRFYMDVLNDNGSKVFFIDYKNIQTSQEVIVSEKAIQDFIEQNYTYTKKPLDYKTVIYNIN